MISAILIGVGIGAVISSAYNYRKGSHQGLVSTKTGLITGIICLIVGLLMHFS
jgi:hypothetical protein